MTRSESLTRLHNAATQPPGFTVVEMMEAQEHGLAAVRAIRRIPTACHGAENAVAVDVDSMDSRIEARLAFRAALDAVGLKTL